MARGEPVAQDIVPFQGERATRSLLGLPTHRCRPPAFPEPEPDGSALDRAAPPPPFDVHGAFDTRVLDAFETRVGGHDGSSFQLLDKHNAERDGE